MSDYKLFKICTKSKIMRSCFKHFYVKKLILRTSYTSIKQYYFFYCLYHFVRYTFNKFYLLCLSSISYVYLQTKRLNAIIKIF